MPRILFTAATASYFAKKSHQPGSARFKQKPPTENATTPISQSTDNYQEQVKLRVRAQLDKVFREVDEELDKRKLDHARLKALNETQCRLAELERKLSMRPEPGSLKPRQERSDRARQAIAPVPVQPQSPPQTPQHIDTCGVDNPPEDVSSTPPVQ